MACTDSTPVLIVGAGVVGLSASLFLAQHGVKSIIVERRSETSTHPRARSVNARTMELFRRLGIADHVREAGASISASAGMFHGRSLREVIEARPRSEGNGKFPFADLMDSVSPVSGTFVTQDMLEPGLVKEARRRGVDLRFCFECTGIEQNTDFVSATVIERQTGETSAIRAEYLIAADGAKSPIRTQLKVLTAGRGSMGYLLNILFYADLTELVRNREFSLCLIERPEVVGLFTSVNNSDRWIFHLHYDPSKNEKIEEYTLERCKHLLRVAIGMEDIEIDIKSILPWEPSIQIAEQLRHGRIFLAGDAAHQMPPYAGQGANSGIADAHNLAWKLAAVLKERSGEGLLETYDSERLSVAREAAEISAVGCDDRGLPPVKRNLEFFKAIWQKLFIVAGFGYGYVSRAICEERTGPLGGLTWRPWTIPSFVFAIDGRPGRRVPHIWIERDGERISTIDICGKNFVLLTGSDGRKWVEASKQVSSSLSVDIDSYCIGPRGELNAKGDEFEAAAGITRSGAILLRPDDFVMWRERRGVHDPEVVLRKAMKQALCHD